MSSSGLSETDDVQDKEETVQLESTTVDDEVHAGVHDMNSDYTSDYTGNDFMAELQIGRKFNLFEEVKELLDKLKASNHPMYMFNSESV